MSKVTFEIYGLRLELLGLMLLVAGTAWQAAFTDWFDHNSRDWVANIQHDANVSILDALDNLSAETASADETSRMQFRDQVHKATSRAIAAAFEQTNARDRLEKGQAKTFATIRYWMLVVGALLVIAGKYLDLAHKTAKGQT